MQPAEPIKAFESLLRGCGYGPSQLAMPFDFDGVSVPIAAFAVNPKDSWSACLAVVESEGDAREAARKVHHLGAAATFVYARNGVECWSQGAKGPVKSRRYSWEELPAVFDQNKDELSPDRIYGAKLNKPDSKRSQLWFFDQGLMPAVEGSRGRTMTRLIEAAIAELQSALKPQLKSRQAQEDMYRTVFWLLAAKILHDKRVPKFIHINLADVDEVFSRIGKHYGDTTRFPPFGKSGRAAIGRAAASIAKCGSLRDVSSESLAYVYENTLIEKAAGPKGKKKGAAEYDIRKVLGIHGTPTVLINHMLSQLWPMIEEIAHEDRHVFEPACGHAPFLTAAMRWLRGDGGSDPEVQTHAYLRAHLHGLEADPFSRELARLSLTLADEPHGNSWDIEPGDMFESGILAEEAAKASILLANPPYETFSPEQKSRYEKSGHPASALTKAVEMVKRTIPNLTPGGVFGVVMPQGVLHDKESRPVREYLLKECELTEVSLFADGLFEHGDHEVAILLGRRRVRMKPGTLMYRRVRERGMDEFKERQAFSSERQVSQTRFLAADSSDILLPDLLGVWDYLAHLPRLSEMVDIQQGFQFLSEAVLEGREVISEIERSDWVRALLRADDGYGVWETPTTHWVNLDPQNIRRPGAASVLGLPQVILNYAPVSRDPWRLKPMIDEQGIAVSSRFLVFRPSPGSFSLQMIWALLNSPVANAYAYCWSNKRETLVKEWREFPVPRFTTNARAAIDKAVEAYFHSAREADAAFMANANRSAVRTALLAVDAQVLKAYDLPPRLERELLDQFQEAPGPPRRNVRKGVGCDFRGYFPPEFRPCIPLHEYLSEAYRRSTAGEIVKNFQPVRSKAALDALEIAGKLAGEG